MDKQKTIRLQFDYSKCISCGGLICIGVCPQGILEEDANKKPSLTDSASCTLCGVCASLCPSKAITIKESKQAKAH